MLSLYIIVVDDVNGNVHIAVVVDNDDDADIDVDDTNIATVLLWILSSLLLLL